MKCVILAGGMGTRISEETINKPKPMIEIGGKPLLWHIMKLYSNYGINDFIICCGYKGYLIKEYFANYFLHMSNVTFNMITNAIEVHDVKAEPWNVTIIDTGENTMTGGRLKRVANFLRGQGTFCFTYGDGLSDIDIGAEIEFHHKHGKLATVCAVKPPGRFGFLDLNGNQVVSFVEKPIGYGGSINGGFFVLSPLVLNLIENDSTPWELGPLHILSQKNELMAYEHNGFWQPMDTLREKIILEDLWASGQAPWKKW